MKYLKFTLFSAIILFAYCSGSKSTVASSTEEIPKEEVQLTERAQQIATKLETDAVTAMTIDSLMSDFRNNRPDFRSMIGDREAMRSAMQKRRTDLNDKVKVLLTEDQFVKFESIMQEEREKMRSQRQGRRGSEGGRP